MFDRHPHDLGPGPNGHRHHHRDREAGGPPPPDPREWRLLGLGRFGLGRVRRGDIRLLILGVLGERPMHGYEMISELETRSRGRWRPSAGSVYPTLQQLADEGLISGEDQGGRRVYRLTEAGEAAVAAAPAPDPWVGEGSERIDLRAALRDLMQAAVQAERAGSADVQRRTTRLIVDARREIYRLLADDQGSLAPHEDDLRADGPEPGASPDGRPEA